MTTEILTFKNKEEYEQWLSRQSEYVKRKAMEFEKRFGKDIVPVVIAEDGDTYCEQGGCHIFVHPTYFQIIRGCIIF